MAVLDYLIQICFDCEGIAAYKELGGSADSPYFNSVVMIFNIELWRKEKWTEKAIQYIQDNKESIYHYDQGVLNALFIDQWGELDAKWNRYLFRRFWWLFSDLRQNIRQISPAIKGSI